MKHSGYASVRAGSYVAPFRSFGTAAPGSEKPENRNESGASQRGPGARVVAFARDGVQVVVLRLLLL